MERDLPTSPKALTPSASSEVLKRLREPTDEAERAAKKARVSNLVGGGLASNPSPLGFVMTIVNETAVPPKVHYPLAGLFASSPSSPISSSEILAKLKANAEAEAAAATLSTFAAPPPPLQAPVVTPTSSPTPRSKLPRNHISVSEKDRLMGLMTSEFPLLQPKVLYFALRHYRFNVDAILVDHRAGKLDFFELEKRYLLEELSNTRKRLVQLDAFKETTAEAYQVPRLTGPRQEHEVGTVIPKPLHWDMTKGDFALISVPLHSEEGLCVFDRFYLNDPKTRNAVVLEKIERVQNVRLFDHYKISQSVIAKRNGNMVNEQLLFHGCPRDAIPSITENGFDIRLSNFKGAAGVGIYFAEFPRTALSYIRDCTANEMKMLLCRVELGASCTKQQLHEAYPQHSASQPIRRPPPRSETDKTPFDSAQGLLRDDPNHPYRVVYDNYQAYPEYIITFKIEESQIIRGKPSPNAATAIGPTHQRYLSQLAETSKSIRFLERSVAYEANKNLPDYPFIVKLLRLLKEDPRDPASIHHTENFNLESLQQLVRYYNKLCTNSTILLLPPIAFADLLMTTDNVLRASTTVSSAASHVLPSKMQELQEYLRGKQLPTEMDTLIAEMVEYLKEAMTTPHKWTIVTSLDPDVDMAKLKDEYQQRRCSFFWSCQSAPRDEDQPDYPEIRMGAIELPFAQRSSKLAKDFEIDFGDLNQVICKRLARQSRKQPDWKGQLYFDTWSNDKTCNIRALVRLEHTPFTQFLREKAPVKYTDQ